jgi:hypothetical protein
MRKELSAYDILQEDPVQPSQQYGIFSYILPDPTKNELHRPMIKFRGAYRTRDECKYHANRLSKLDEHQYVNIYEIQMGSWGSLFNEEELSNQDIDIEYSNELMNEMMKGYRDQKDKVDNEYNQRKEQRTAQLRFDSSKEGQKYLDSIGENIISIKDRLEKHKEDLKLNLENIIYVEKRLKYNQDLDIKLKELQSQGTLGAEREEEILENDTFLTESIKQIDEQIAKFEEQIKLLQEKKGGLDRQSIVGRIRDNADLIQYSLDNKVYLQEKIDELKQNIKDAENLIKEKEQTQDQEMKDRLQKDTLTYAVNNLKL